MSFVISIIGPSGSGKTTLIERLIQKLSGKGLVVAAIKCAHHQIDMDRPGKDSNRLKEAGAASVGVVSPDGWAIIADEPKISIENLLAKLPSSDLVITEGGSRLNTPKIEVIPPSATQPSKSPTENLIALVGKTLHHDDLPCFDRNNISGITEFLIGFMDNK
jgi:molybdopterin-guanine dinucleotide biosynthesis protein B